MKTVQCAPPRRWGLAEWGSVASIIALGLWFYDQLTKRPDPSSTETIES